MQLMFGKLIADIARFKLNTDFLLKFINTLYNNSKYWLKRQIERMKFPKI